MGIEFPFCKMKSTRGLALAYNNVNRVDITELDPYKWLSWSKIFLFLLFHMSLTFSIWEYLSQTGQLVHCLLNGFLQIRFIHGHNLTATTTKSFLWRQPHILHIIVPRQKSTPCTQKMTERPSTVETAEHSMDLCLRTHYPQTF